MTRPSRIAGYLLLAITLAASVWSAALTFGGGMAIQSPWGRISSRDPVRPLALGLIAGVLFAFLERVIPLLGLLAPLTERRRGTGRLVALVVVAFPLVIAGLYLPYTPFEDWSYLPRQVDDGAGRSGWLQRLPVPRCCWCYEDWIIRTPVRT